jgi:hypothetical protein
MWPEGISLVGLGGTLSREGCVSVDEQRHGALAVNVVAESGGG